MFSKQYTVPTVAISVADLIYDDVSDTQRSVIDTGLIISDIIMQADEFNGGKIYFGSPDDQTVYIKADGSSGIFKINLTKLTIKGNGSDKINIFLP